MTFLTQALIFLAAAVVCVPIARKMGMGSVLGYLIAGILIGPFVLGLVGNEGEDIMHFAEFGVVMMLFIIGLELEPHQFWKMRRSIAGMGSIQVAGTSALIFAGFLAAGLTWKLALTASLAFAMSSTAIVLQTIREKGLSQTAAGQSSFAVLLFQDIMVIPVLAILPLLAADVIASPAMNSGETTGWMQGLLFAGAVIAIIFAGRFLIVPLLRIVAKTNLRELFTASSLLLVVAVALLMQELGLSPALGTFLAGVVLANSEYRHELESDLEPFKGLLLGLFFIGVGASVNFGLIIDKPAIIALLVAGVMAAKFIVLFISGRLFGLSSDQNILYSFALSQVGEFAFVILSYSGQLSIISREWTDILMAVTAITMTITPLLLLINERWIDPLFGVKESSEIREADEITDHNEVIIAGFGHFGSTAGRFLKANGVAATILDHDSDRVRLLRNMGFKVYYGDATRVDLLASAGADKAKILIAAIDPPETNHELIRVAAKHFPNLRIMARAKNRMDAYDLTETGITDIYRESLHTSVKIAVDALINLGHRSYTATRLGQKFISYDEETLKEMALHRHDIRKYINKARETFRIQEELLQKDLLHEKGDEDHAWDSEQIKEKLK
jgi:CPA2 family monovalent cation:H+ antiporter-2